MTVINIIAVILVGSGLVFFLGGAVGIIRLPDCYTRLHAAGKLDTAGLLLIMSGLAVYTLGDFTLNSILTGAKIIFIVILVFVTSPTATHALIDAGFIAGLKPWTQRTRNDLPSTITVETEKESST
jgi:multicomponent Na+:H+ antiporter subunit G